MMEDTEDREMMEHHEEKELSFKIVSKDDDQRARPGRRTSKVWQVFNRLDQSNAQCSICSRVLSFKSSVTNLSKHIQRKHTSAYMSMCSEEDPREGLKEFITIDGHREGDDDDIDDSGMRADDSEWAPPSKLAKKATPSKKVVKKEVISSNGVDYVIYTQDHTPKPTLARAAKKIPVTPPSRTIANLSSMKLETVASIEPPQRRPVEEDEFTTFAKFLSQRIRTLKSPYWQSCAINEINSALHRVEMRCYEVPKVDSAQRYSQTDPLGGEVLDADASSINDANPLENVLHAEV